MFVKRIVAVILLLAGLGACFSAICEGDKVFILCDPKTPVNVRARPKRGSEIVGRLEFGDWIETDWKKRNGFLHVYGIGEAGEGWIFAGYIVQDEPEKLEKAWASIGANGRVKSYRWINGKRKEWLKVCEQVKVYAISEEWAYTDKGYIRTKYLEVWYE